MKTLTLLTIIAAISILTSTSFAKTCDGSTMEMVGCLIEKAEKSQKEVESSTIELKAILENSKQFGDGEPSDYDIAKNELDVANKNYMTFVTSQCGLEGKLETMTGSLAKVVSADCVANLTKNRASYLKKLVKAHSTSN